MVIVQRNVHRLYAQRGRQEIWHSLSATEESALKKDGFGFLVAFDEVKLPPGENIESSPGINTETVIYVYSGALLQEETARNSVVIQTGEFQHRSIGDRTGHQDTNASPVRWAHVFRASFRSSEVGLKPTHDQKRFTEAQRHNALCVIASSDGRRGSLRIRQDAIVYSGIFDAGYHIFHQLMPGRSAWLHVVHGRATIDDAVLISGDGVGISDEPAVSLIVTEELEMLLVDSGPTYNPPTP